MTGTGDGGGGKLRGDDSKGAVLRVYASMGTAKSSDKSAVDALSSCAAVAAVCSMFLVRIRAMTRTLAALSSSDI